MVSFPCGISTVFSGGRDANPTPAQTLQISLLFIARLGLLSCFSAVRIDVIYAGSCSSRLVFSRKKQ
ncbi:hypothetical protein Y032_0107g3821 [Ancylostoma ceylanicum]|uniref:Uncharacterized protein n=1 Tax=Ancylostoma ceylanicum TaxID=53326 RepID=A0A016TFN3_9BILA|nr:hypothetical protein Y032_0107g3821 [Ancylostoma ceylanicum]